MPPKSNSNLPSNGSSQPAFGNSSLGNLSREATRSNSGKAFVGVDLTHQSINGYRILHRLGAGGMAEVYLAFHETLQRHVAIKVLRADLAESSDHTTRFLQEARAAASLIHPNIVQVYDVGSSGSIQFIAQEYIPGVSLRNLIQRRGTLGVPETLSISLQIASALSKAASVGVVHRDIKPDNILLNSEGEVKVADFGLARARSQNSNLTEVGVALGTPLYMSPEQIQGKAVDPRSDLYSLGITMYEMLSGHAPFQGDTPLAIAMQHVQNKPADLSALRPDVSTEIVEIINKLLEKEADNRFASASDLVRAIRRVSDSLSLSISLENPLPLSGIVIDLPLALGTHTTRLQSLAFKDTVEKSNSWYRLTRGQLLAITGIIATSILTGYWVASWDKKPLLQPPKELVASVKKRANVREQFFYAIATNSPADWHAVEEYFPPETSPLERNYNVKAWMHLAWTDLALNNVQESLDATKKILEMSGAEKVMRVSAMIARSIAFQRLGNDLESKEELKKAKTEFAVLDESDRKMVESTLPAVALRYWFSES